MGTLVILKVKDKVLLSNKQTQIRGHSLISTLI